MPTRAGAVSAIVFFVLATGGLSARIDKAEGFALHDEKGQLSAAADVAAISVAGSGTMGKNDTHDMLHVRRTQCVRWGDPCGPFYWCCEGLTCGALSDPFEDRCGR